MENIKSHLQNVDDIPLHVSLFAECSPISVREMIKVFQENGEVVCVIGSSMNLMNLECFSTADIAVAVDPIPRGLSKEPMSFLAAGASLTSISCAISLQSDTSVYTLTQLIREARTLAENSKQAFKFYIGCMLCLVLNLMISFLLGFPPMYAGYQLMWLSWLILPLISFSFLFTPHDHNVYTFNLGYDIS